MNHDLKFCLVGRGSIGTRHLKNLQSLGYRNVVAFSVSENPEKDKDWLDKYGVMTLRSLHSLQNYQPDVLLVANPTSKHIETANLALDLNAHIFMEKPLSHSLAGVLEFRQRLIEKNRIFFQANCLRFHPAFRKIKTILEQGELGKL